MASEQHCYHFLTLEPVPSWLAHVMIPCHLLYLPSAQMWAMLGKRGKKVSSCLVHRWWPCLFLLPRVIWEASNSPHSWVSVFPLSSSWKNTRHAVMTILTYTLHIIPFFNSLQKYVLSASHTACILLDTGEIQAPTRQKCLLLLENWVSSSGRQPWYCGHTCSLLLYLLKHIFGTENLCGSFSTCLLPNNFAWKYFPGEDPVCIFSAYM